MKLKCISTSTRSISDNTGIYFRWLTIDKIYDMQHLGTTDNYYVIDDRGVFVSYPKHCFIDLQDFRELKLNQLGI